MKTRDRHLNVNTFENIPFSRRFCTKVELQQTMEPLQTACPARGKDDVQNRL